MIFSESYQELLQKFKNQGYNFIHFDELNAFKNNQLILRHDIDLEIDCAIKIASLEYEMGIKSTYFFLLKDESYNLLSTSNQDKVKKIRKLGHQISLHFDLSIYQDPKEGLKEEIKIFNSSFSENINIISIHRPNNDFLENPKDFFHIDNSYEEKFTKNNICYYADSGGSFRFGHPTESNEFKNCNNMQLLIHPVWWTIRPKEQGHSSIKEAVQSVIDNKKSKMENHFKKNIKTFK